MVTIMNPGSILSQLTNFFFLASGLFNDLLIIRLCLTFAYGFLLISGLLGLPGWGAESLWTGRIAIDIVVWSIVNIVVVHGSGVLRMYYDERSIDFETEEDEMLWRFFYRHSGLSKAQFQALILPHLTLRIFEEGDPIPCKDNFYIILDGMVVCEIVHEDAPTKRHKIRLASGDMFPLLHIYKNYVPRKAVFHRSAIQNPVVDSSPSASSPVAVVRAFSIPLEQLEAMATHPNARDAWTALLIASLAEIAERQYANFQNDSSGNGVVDGSRTAKRLSSGDTSFPTTLPKEIHHPLFQPLAPSEEPDPLLAGSGGGLSRPLRHAFRYMALSAYMPWPFGKWPVGLRHSLRPPTDPEGCHRDLDTEQKAQQSHDPPFQP